MTADDKRRLAQLRLRARRRHDGDLRRRALFLSLLVFGVLWLAIFAQLVSGHDPVLGTGAKVAVERRQAARQRRASATESKSKTSPSLSTEATPTPLQSAPAQPAATPVPAPTPVVTSQS